MSVRLPVLRGSWTRWKLAFATVATVATATTAVPGSLSSQQPAEALITDRPGAPDGAWVLGAGVWQLEMGTALLIDDAINVALGQGLVRVGLGPLEARLYPNSYVVGNDAGLQGLGLGVKVPIVRGPTRLSAMAGVTLPSRNGQAGGDRTSVFSAAIWETALSPHVSLNVNAGYSFSASDPGRGTVLLAITPGFTVSAEHGIGGYAGLVAYLTGNGPSASLETGVTKRIHPDLQVDLNAGLAPRAGPSYVGVGLSYRWP